MAFDGILRKDTAVDVLIGPFVDATDGVTPETGLTIQVDVSKNGQALADRSDATNPTHDAAGTVDGYYNCELDATDTNTAGNLVLACFASGALQVRHAYQIVEEVVYDVYYATGATGAVPVASIANDAITAASIAANAIGAAEIADGAIDAGAIAADAFTAAKFAADVATELQSGLATSAALATVSTNVDAILVDTAEIGAAGAGLTAINLPNQTMDIAGNITGNLSGSVGSVTVVSDKTGYAIGAGGIANTAFAAGAIDAAAIAANALGAAELAQDAAREIADEVLDRDLAGGASGDSRGVRNALRSLRNKVEIVAGTATIYQENDTDAAWTATVATTAGDPISGVDPA